jgi:CheY-like chemotaxis protein
MSGGERIDMPRGQAVILVVEDDRDVRNVAVTHLRTLGYEVLEASDGPSAEAVLKGAEAIDLVFTDMVMPGGMSGRDVAARARRHRPGIKILFTSGYAEQPLLHHDDVLSGAAPLLGKPYRLRELAAAVREALGADSYCTAK